MSLVSKISKSFKKDVRLNYFGTHQELQLSEHNIVSIDSPAVQIGKQMTFGAFKRNIYWYSELMDTPCRELLPIIEARAIVNAKRGKVAKNNLIEQG